MTTTTIMTTNMSVPVSQSRESRAVNIGFGFRQFFVRHDCSSMKVGTDGVLLGAWVPIEPLAISHWPLAISLPTANSQRRILDVGTGSGLIALMLAQRTAGMPDVRIDAIDIDEASCRQARENVDASPWAERLHVAQSSLQEWQTVQGNCPNGTWYDLIVSNPPYFVHSLKAPDAARCAARHNDTLPFDVLMTECNRLLKPKGMLALIVPCEAEDELQTLAAAEGLQCLQKCYVHPKPGRPAKRVMIAWGKERTLSEETAEQVESLVLEDAQGGRSDAYKQLTKEFYL